MTEYDVLPPWLISPEPSKSLRWRMGGGQDHIDKWARAWRAMTSEKRAQYAQRFPPPDADWQSWLDLWLTAPQEP